MMLRFLELNGEFETTYLMRMYIIYFIYIFGNQNFLLTC